MYARYKYLELFKQQGQEGCKSWFVFLTHHKPLTRNVQGPSNKRHFLNCELLNHYWN